MHPLTGRFIPTFVDLNLASNDSLSLKRTFVGGKWHFVPQQQLVLEGHKSKRGFYLYPSGRVKEPNGVEVFYTVKPGNTSEWTIDKSRTGPAILANHPKGFKGQKLFRSAPSRIALSNPEGILREYEWTGNDGSLAYYILREERLSSGLVVSYHYDHYDRLEKIALLSPQKTQTLGFFSFHYTTHSDGSEEIDVHSSDGRSVHYRFTPSCSDSVVMLTECSGETSTSFAYAQDENSSPVLLDPLGRVDYASQEGGGRVGRYRSKQGTISLHFHENSLELVYEDGRKTLLFCNSDGFPTLQEEYDSSLQLQRQTEWKWGSDGELLEQCVKNGEGISLSFEEYVYDEEGNCIQQILTGDLRGDGSKRSVETLRSYTNPHLVKMEKGPDGITIETQYVAGTPLILSRRWLVNSHCFKRQFFYYDSHLLLEKQVMDDGSGEDSEDLSDVQVRKMLLFHRNAQGVLLSQEEFYLNGENEDLLLKIEFLYSSLGNCMQRRYYDNRGALLKVSDFPCLQLPSRVNGLPEGMSSSKSLSSLPMPSPRPVLASGVKEEGCHYSLDGLLESRSSANGTTTKWIYDSRRRLAALQLISDEEELLDQLIFEYHGSLLASISKLDGSQLYFSYDKYGRLIEESYLTSSGLEKELFFYDALGRLIRTQHGERTQEIDYDSDDRPTAIRWLNKDGSLIPNQEFDFEQVKSSHENLEALYDSSGRLLELRSTDSAIHLRYLYTLQGRLFSIRDIAQRSSLVRAYDAKGRIVSEVLPNGSCISFSYDLSGRRKKMTLPDDSCLVYSYREGVLCDVSRFNKKGKRLYSHQFEEFALSGIPLKQRLIEGLGLVEYELDQMGLIAQVQTPFGTWSDRANPSSIPALPLTQIGQTVVLEEGKKRSEWDYDGLSRCIAQRTYEKSGSSWTLKDLEAYFFDGMRQIGSMNQEGKLQSFRVCAPFITSSRDGSLVFEWEGHTYVPLFDPLGTLRLLLSVRSRAPVELESVPLPVNWLR